MKKILVLAMSMLMSLSAFKAEAQKKQDTQQRVYECSFDCPSCEAKVMKNIPYEKGVKDVKVDYDAKLVTIAYKDGKNTEEGLKTALEKLGYEVSLKGAPESFGVNGNCDMCKSKIETAAKSVDGVSAASWSESAKTIAVVYDKNTTTIDAIHQAIANVGYDTDKVKAKDEVYEQLHHCCKYER